MAAPSAIDTAILLRDVNDPNNAYLPPTYTPNGSGYWPDDEASFYPGTFFDQIWMYGQLDRQEQLYQAEVEEIIERMGPDEEGDTTLVNDVELSKSTRSSSPLSRSASTTSLSVTPLMLHTSTLRPEHTLPHNKPESPAATPLGPTASLEAAIASFTTDLEEGNAVLPLTQSNNVPYRHPTDSGRSQALDQVKTDSSHGTSLLKEGDPAALEAATSQGSCKTRLEEIRAAFPIDIHVRYFLNCGKSRPRQSHPLLSRKQIGSSISDSFASNSAKAPFMVRNLATIPSPNSSTFAFSDNGISGQTVMGHPSEAMSGLGQIISPSSQPTALYHAGVVYCHTPSRLYALEVLADVAGEQSRFSGQSLSTLGFESEWRAGEINDPFVVARETSSSPISRDEWDTTESEGPAKPRPLSRVARTDGAPGALAAVPDGPSPPARLDTGYGLETTFPLVRQDAIQTKDDKRLVLEAIERGQNLNVTVEDCDSPLSIVGVKIPEDKSSKAKSEGDRQNEFQEIPKADQLEQWAAVPSGQEKLYKYSASARKRKLQDLIDGPAPLDNVDLNLAEKRDRLPQLRPNPQGTQKALPKRSKANADTLCIQESGIGPVIDLKPYVPRDRRRPDFYKMPPISGASIDGSTLRTQTCPSTVHRGPRKTLIASVRPGMTVTPIEAIGNEAVPSRGEPESENDGDDDEECENRPTSHSRRQKRRWSVPKGTISPWTPAEEAILLAHWDGRGALTTQTQLEMSLALAAQGYHRTPQAVKFRFSVRNSLRGQFDKKAAELAELDEGLDEDAEGESVEGDA